MDVEVIEPNLRTADFCPLSLWERVRVRAIEVNNICDIEDIPSSDLRPPSPQGEGNRTAFTGKRLGSTTQAQTILTRSVSEGTASLVI
tara:strand:+ start:1515 stop:1778 length:264 start_codon:yes stop_codon:yes gene_type:complete